MGLKVKSAPSAVVGLDIGSDLIKVSEAKLVKGGMQITALGVAPTPPASVDNSNIVDPQALGAAIKKLLRDSGIKTKLVVSTILGQSAVVVRVIEVPKMTREELAETMKWEVERHVPFAPSEILMDFAPLDRPNSAPDAQSMEVLLAVAQQGAVNSHVLTLFAAGLEPFAIDVQPLAISRALIDMSKEDLPQTTAIVNVGATTSDVGVFEGDVLTFPGPPLPIAGINFTRAISEALGVPEEEAERLKRQYAVADAPMMQQTADDLGDDAQQQPYSHEPTSFDTSFTQYDTQGDALPTDANPPDQAASPLDLSAAPVEPAEGVGEPAPYDPAQHGPDFSPFDFGAAAPMQDETQAAKFDISGKDDVFDLGSGTEATDFKPVFDLDEPGGADSQVARPVMDFDVDGDDASPTVGAGSAPDSSLTSMDFDTLYPDPPVQPVHDFGQEISNAINPVLIELATEIRRSLEYYTTRYQSRPEQIFLCGGTAKLRNIDKFLEAELGVPVRVANPMANLTVNCPKCTPSYLNEVSALFPVSIGLAIREMLE